jgi:2-oxoacid:acceptor oxidoreductase gamma subunit (pyruvate/2-ketoisovalerate family)
MGAPVTAFTRISNEPIRLHCAVYSPDVVAVLDPTLLKSVKVADGLNEETGDIIINSKDHPSILRQTLNPGKGRLWTVPATEISIRILGMPITNTAMLGAVARVTSIVSLETIDRMIRARFRADVAQKNLAVVKEAFQEAKSE